MMAVHWSLVGMRLPVDEHKCEYEVGPSGRPVRVKPGWHVKSACVPNRYGPGKTLVETGSVRMGVVQTIGRHD